MKPEAASYLRRIIRPASWGFLFLGMGLGGCVHQSRLDFQSAWPAAQRGDARAQYDLARCYARGAGVPQDYAKAAASLRQSADQGYAIAQADLGSYYARGLGVSKDLSEALKWYRKAAAQRDALAEYCLGYAYAHGEGVPTNFDEAIAWWRSSTPKQARTGPQPPRSFVHRRRGRAQNSKARIIRPGQAPSSSLTDG
jgi:TPR repeat protein